MYRYANTQWIKEKYSFGSITRNEYYNAYLVRFETAAYHNGEQAGGDLAQQLFRMNEVFLTCDVFGGCLRFDTVQDAQDFCEACGVIPYVGHVIYHVDGSYRIE